MFKHIAVVGVGSGGSALTEELVRYGVEELTLMDPDKLERSNLSRHVLHQGDLYRYKVDGMKERIHRIARTTMISQDACRVVAICEGFSAERINEPRLVLKGIDWYHCCPVKSRRESVG